MRIADNGKVCITVKYGSKALELANGKPTVEVSTTSDLVLALETLKSAIAAGELDAQIDAASTTLRTALKNSARI